MEALCFRIWDFNSGDDDIIINKAIDRQEAYYEEIGMPTNIRCLGVKESDLEILALRCSRNHTRILDGDKPLGYNEMLDIYKMAFYKE